MCSMQEDRWRRGVASRLAVLVVLSTILLCSCSSPDPQVAFRAGRIVSDSEYQKLLAHVAGVGPTTIHWYAQSGEPRRLVCAVFGADSLVLETWIPVGTDTVNWSDMWTERVRMVDRSCDGTLDSATSFAPEDGDSLGRPLPEEAAEWFWVLTRQIACELSDFRGGSPLTVFGPHGHASKEPDLSQAERAIFESVLRTVLARPLSDAELAELEATTRSYVSRTEHRMSLWQLDVVRLAITSAFDYDEEMGRCLLQSIDTGELHVSTELKRLRTIQVDWGLRSQAELDEHRRCLHSTVTGEPYIGADGELLHPTTRAETVEGLRRIELARGNYRKIDELFDRLIEEYGEPPAAARSARPLARG